MGRKKRRSSKFRDSSTVIDMDQARRERQKEREQKQKKTKDRKRPPRSARIRTAAARENVRKVSARAADMAEAAGNAAGKMAAGVVQVSGPGEEETRGNVRQDRRRMALRRRRRTWTLILGGVMVGLLVMVGFSVGNIILLTHDLHTAQKEQQTYIEEKKQLEEDLKQSNDLEKLEEQARDQMRLVKPGETLYIFPESTTPGETKSEETKPEKTTEE